MIQMKEIITLLTLLLTSLSSALPVTSKALDNNSDQLIWQTAWYSHLNEGHKETPFTGDSRKITAKSIFITPNFNPNISNCPPGYRIDDKGKCIKVVNINPGDLLVTQLQNFFSQTTDDTTSSIDYDYSFENEEESQEPTHFTLPLIPIINDNDTNLYTINEHEPEPESSTVQYEIELNNYSFRKPNHTENSADGSNVAPTTESNDVINQQENEYDQDEVINSTLIDSNENFDKENVTEKDQKSVQSSMLSFSNGNSTAQPPNQTRVDENNINLSQNDTATVESLSSIEQTEPTETELPEMTSRDTTNSEDQFNEDDNDSTTLSELVINESESLDGLPAEKTISNETIRDDYFDTILLNDSLIIDESFSYGNANDSDYDSTTVQSFLPFAFEDYTPGEKSLENKTDVDGTITSTTIVLPSSTTGGTESSLEDFTRPLPQSNDYENRIIKDDQQNLNLENVEASNKFVYHHLSATESLSDEHLNVLATPPSTVVRFPTHSEETREKQLVRFPDETSPNHPPPTMGFSWPRDNTYQAGGLMRFWQEQPLINDFKFVSRGNSRGPSGGFNRLLSYRRN